MAQRWETGRGNTGEVTASANQIRRYRRFTAWNYANGASLFITIATAPRRALFGRIANGKVELSPLGRIVEEALFSMPRLNPGIMLFGHVVMPDHIHFNVHVQAGLPEPLKTLGNAIRRFKNYTTKQAKLSLPIATCGSAGNSGDGRTVFGQTTIWQQGYHDILCPTRAKIDATERYIAYNPLKWELMYGVAHCLWVREPLDSPRLDSADYWKGVGNVALLAPSLPMVSLRVSMKVRDAAAIAAVVRRLENAVAKGYVIASGFISKGEQAVRDMLCRNKDARFVRIRPSALPNARFKPESLYVDAFAEGRYLEIAKGNEEVEFGRGACLDLNAEIVEIATAGEGLALHWREDGPHIIGRGRPVEPSSTIATGCWAGNSGDGRTVFGHLGGRPQ